MDNHAIFVRELITDKIKVKPQLLGKNMAQVLKVILAKKFEGICSHHGYIKPGSIEIVKYSAGNLLSVSLNGDVSYIVCFKADICNPTIGCKVVSKVINMNKFGILAETGITIGRKFIPILEIIIAKHTVDMSSSVNLETIKIGDVITVEILGKKYELMDKKISIVGRVLSKGLATSLDPIKSVVGDTVTDEEFESDGDETVKDVEDLGVDESDVDEEDSDAEIDVDADEDKPEVEDEVEDEAEVDEVVKTAKDDVDEEDEDVADEEWGDDEDEADADDVVDGDVDED